VNKKRTSDLTAKNRFVWIDPSNLTINWAKNDKQGTMRSASKFVDITKEMAVKGNNNGTGLVLRVKDKDEIILTTVCLSLFN
jgi:hypothetical protein